MASGRQALGSRASISSPKGCSKSAAMAKSSFSMDASMAAAAFEGGGGFSFFPLFPPPPPAATAAPVPPPESFMGSVTASMRALMEDVSVRAGEGGARGSRTRAPAGMDTMRPSYTRSAATCAMLHISKEAPLPFPGPYITGASAARGGSPEREKGSLISASDSALLAALPFFIVAASAAASKGGRGAMKRGDASKVPSNLPSWSHVLTSPSDPLVTRACVFESAIFTMQVMSQAECARHPPSQTTPGGPARVTSPSAAIPTAAL